jgi:hypothetical protein
VSVSRRLLQYVPLFLCASLAACGDDDSTAPTAGASDIRFLNVSNAVDLTPDGSLAVLQDFFSPSGDLYFYHTATGSLEFKTRVGSPLRDFATAVSQNGVVTALYDDPVNAGFWTAAGDWTYLASAYTRRCGDDIAGAWDVSAAGNVIVGLVWNGCNAEAFRWDSRGTGIMTPLQLLGESYPGSSNPPTNRATVVSDDGNVAAGFAQTALVDRWPAIWKADGTGFLLPQGEFPIDAPGEVLSISEDGGMVAGVWNLQGFYWTQADGIVQLGSLSEEGGSTTYPNAIAASGKLIFGSNGSFLGTNAFVWTAAAGMRALADVATAAGVEIAEGYVLTNVLGASTDGTVVLGSALSPEGAPVTFVLRLPTSAYGI